MSPGWSKGKSYLFSQRRKWSTPAVACPQAGSSRAHSGSYFQPPAPAPGSLCNRVFALFLFSLITARVCKLAGISWWLSWWLSLKISTCCYRSCVSRGFHYPYPPPLNVFISRMQVWFIQAMLSYILESQIMKGENSSEKKGKNSICV